MKPAGLSHFVLPLALLALFAGASGAQIQKRPVPVKLPTFRVPNLNPPRPAVPSWSLVNSFGVQLPNKTWMSGRIWDALEMSDGQVLATTDFSGVWWLIRGQPAVSLSHDWATNWIYSLAKDTGHPNNYFAGGSTDTGDGAGILYSTNPATPAPLFNPWITIPLPPGTGVIHRILTMDNPPKILLATQSGLLWADIPASGPYRWHSAVGMAQGGFWDVKEAAGHAILAGSIGFNPNVGPATPMVTGAWSGTGDTERLTLANVSIGSSPAMPYNPAVMSTVSVAVAPSDPQVMYALSSDGNGMMTRLYRSGDGGANWVPKPAAADSTGAFIGPATEGRQGVSFNNTIAVSSNDPNAVALGWVHLWMSQNGGDTFTQLGGHDDHHTVAFFGPRFYDCSDGGIQVSSDLGRTFNDEYARRVPNLMFYPYAFDILLGGTSYVGGGPQDHSAVVCTINPNGQATPWFFPETRSSADSGPVTFGSNGMVWTVAVDGVYHYSTYANPDTDAGEVPIEGATDAERVNGRFIHSERLFRVVSPLRRDSRGRLMTALIYTEQGVPQAQPHPCHIYGIFTDASGAVISHLVDVPVPANGMVAALGSYDGDIVYVGMGPNSTVKAVNLATGVITDQTGLPGDGNWYVDSFAFGSSTSNFLLRSQSRGNSEMYQRTSANGWTKISGLPNVPLTGLVCDGPTNVYVGVPDGIMASHNNFGRWDYMNTGLPTRLHPTRLLVGTDFIGRKWLFLSTFGWSAWKYPLN